MSITATAAINAALLQLGVFDPGETPSTSEYNAALLIANEMLANWYNEQAQAIAVLLKEQAQEGIGFIANQTKSTGSLSAAYTLANGTYTAPTYTAGSYTPGTLPAFPDLTTAQTFPTGYELAIVLGLAMWLLPQYPAATVPPQVLQQNYQAAKAAATPMPGRVPLPGTGYSGVLGEAPQQGA
jgi:hypothetical protein